VNNPVTGRSLGLLVCLACQATVHGTQAAHLRCPRCRARLHERKPHSLALTTALIIAAAVLYIPANILPVMTTREFFEDEPDTILSGVLVLLQSGSWPIAILVFVASIVVPLLKILAMAVLLYSAWRPSPGRRQQRSHPAVDRAHVKTNAGPTVDAGRNQAVIEFHQRRAHVGSSRGPAAQIHEAGGLLDPAGENTPRPMQLEASPHELDAVRQ